MSIEFDNTAQSLRLFAGAQEKLFKKVHHSSKNNSCIRPIVPIIVTADVLIILSQKIATVCETLFKGTINIIGKPFSNNFEVNKGLNQLFYQLPYSTLDLVASTIALVIHSMVISFNLIKDPIANSKSYKDQSHNVLAVLDQLVARRVSPDNSNQEYLCRKLRIHYGL